MSLEPERAAPEEVGAAIRAGDRRALARTITLLESARADFQRSGQAVLEFLMPQTGGSRRIGITGPPGVGKSSLIETLGLQLVEDGHRVAVLAVDPSSPLSKGSILGDKTRMERLARHEAAFIRPTPSGGALGGVASRTREALLLCEAAGFDVVLVETVGIGQSEVAVAAMVDFFLVLVQPGGGDELQGIKKGVLELADALVVTKADGDTASAARRSQSEHAQALRLLRPPASGWEPRCLLVSAHSGEGIRELWELIQAHEASTRASGEHERRRREQARAWMWNLVEEGLRQSFRSHPSVAGRISALEREVEEARTSPGEAARRLLAAFVDGG